jgi:hypothetical protein
MGWIASWMASGWRVGGELDGLGVDWDGELDSHQMQLSSESIGFLLA